MCANQKILNEIYETLDLLQKRPDWTRSQHFAHSEYATHIVEGIASSYLHCEYCDRQCDETCDLYYKIKDLDNKIPVLLHDMRLVMDDKKTVAWLKGKWGHTFFALNGRIFLPAYSLPDKTCNSFNCEKCQECDIDDKEECFTFHATCDT